ncbi:hypothetical protein [uncultured Shimia sp.]|uniref:hypothetical protein n=1 Tax=uncultured Shimia sp. TaxID=573152 RepID=UPI00261E3000|nr:hypothetical protein [uncultured Shimia sp.]
MKKQYVFNAMSRFYGDSLKTVIIGLLGLVTSLLLVFTTFVQDSSDGAETNNGDDATVAYHSRTPKVADKYKARLQRVLAHSPDQAVMPAKAVQKAKPLLRIPTVNRENNFPLLQRGSSAGTMGSLVPRGSGSGRSMLSNGG